MATEPPAPSPFSISYVSSASPGRSANVSERLAQLTAREQDVSAAWGAGSKGSAGYNSVAATPSRAPVFVTPARMPHPAVPPSASSRGGGSVADAQLAGSGALDLSFSLDIGGGGPGGALPAFSQEFVRSLQAQHQQRLNDSLAASAELLRSKDRELESLHQRNMQLLHAGAAAQEEAQAKIDSLVKEQREIIADVQQLAAKHEQERTAIQAHHESVLQQLSAAFQDQLSQAVLRASQEAESAAAASRAHHAGVEAHLTQQMREQQAAHQQQMQQQQQDIRRAMQLENERAAAAHEESTSQVLHTRFFSILCAFESIYRDGVLTFCADYVAQERMCGLEVAVGGVCPLAAPLRMLSWLRVLTSVMQSCDRELQQLRESESLESRRRTEFRQQQQLLQEQQRAQQQEMQQRTTAAESAAGKRMRRNHGV
jgi:hypothetical protein